MFFKISLLALLLATFARVLASPPHEPSVLSPQLGHHPARGMSILPVSHDSKANRTLVKRDWKTKCKGVTLCTEENLKGNCMSWCYEPDKFEDMIHSVRTNLRSVKLEKGVDCWFVKMNQCTKNNILNRPMIFMAEPGGDIPLQLRGQLGCFICPAENADYLM